MAHECPICYSNCHCGGDIDDMCLNGTEEELMCRHCPDDWDDEDDEDFWDVRQDDDDSTDPNDSRNL